MELLWHKDRYLNDQGKTVAETYLESVLDGSIVSGEKMKKLARKMLPRIRNGYKRWYFDVDYACYAVSFVEAYCKIPAGKLGEPFILEPFQICITMLIFGFVDSFGNRQFQYALIEMARKNGKTSWVAAIELFMLIADGEGAPQIYNAATSKPQASLAYGSVWDMVCQSDELLEIVRTGIVKKRKETGIICDSTLGYIIPLSKQSKNLDGLNVHCAALDELAAMEDRAIYDLVRQGIGAREQPLIIAITTQGFVRDNIWDHEREYALKWLDDEFEDDRFIAFLFEQDDREEMWDESLWLKSNPGLGTIKKVEYLRAQLVKAENDPAYMPTVLTKDFNLPANKASSYFSYEESVNEEKFTFNSNEFRYCIVGFDAADTIDMNAARAIFMKPNDNRIYQLSMYWLPEDQVRINSNNQRGRDGVPYQEWIGRGLLRTVPGNTVPKSVILEWMTELCEMGLLPFAFGYDRWHIDDSLKQRIKAMVGESRVEPIAQGSQTLSTPTKEYKAMLRDNLIVDNHNPINEWCRTNVGVKYDTNSNLTIVKSDGPTQRIDGFIAEICAYIAFQRHKDDYLSLIGYSAT